MTKEELKAHCIRQIQRCERRAEWNREEPHGKVYEEHKLILELLEQELCKDKIIDEHYWKGFNNGIRTEKFRESKREHCDDYISRQAVLDIDFKKIILTTAKPAETIEQKVKALSSVTPQPCEDAISRQAVLDLVCADWKYENLEADIASLPPVTSQPKVGHWIIIDDCEQFIAKCSECGRIEDSRMINKYPYCHCGTKMVKDEG